MNSSLLNLLIKKCETKAAKIKAVVKKSNSGQLYKYMVKPKYTDPWAFACLHDAGLFPLITVHE